MFSYSLFKMVEKNGMSNNIMLAFFIMILLPWIIYFVVKAIKKAGEINKQQQAINKTREIEAERLRKTEEQKQKQIIDQQNRQIQEEKRRKDDEIRRIEMDEQKRASALIRQQKEDKRKEYITSLLTSGDIIPTPDHEMVTCSNNHHYKYADFNIVKRHISTYTYISQEKITNRLGDITGYQDVPITESEEEIESQKGCKLCESTVYSFDNANINNYNECYCGYWYNKNRYNSCPICSKKW